MLSKCCGAEVFTSSIINRCLRCGRDVEVTTSASLPSFKGKDEKANTSEVSTVGYMDKPLGSDLNKHFMAIAMMLAEGEVPEYEMVSEFEVHKFEDFLKKYKINYIKRSIFNNHPVYLFSIPEEM